MSDNFNGFGIIWDVDGTLVDTGELHFESWVKLAADMGREFTRQDFADTFGRRNPEIVREKFGDHFTPEEVAQMGEQKEIYYRSEAKHGVDLLPGVGRLLEELAAAGYKQALGSSAPHANLELITDITESHRYFSAIVGMEDTTRGKPDPQVFLVAAERLDIPPERCLVMEDAIAGVQAAAAGGMKCIAVTFVGHHPEEKLREAGANLVVSSLEQLTMADIARLLGS